MRAVFARRDAMHKHTSLVTIALVFGILVLGIPAAHAQTVAVGPYYATPSLDQTLPAATRFVVLSNYVDGDFPSGGAAVLDRETGLVWERAPSRTIFSWYQALDHCNQSTTGGRLGWKLPTIQEMNSINDPSVTAFPFLPSGHPFSLPMVGVRPGTFWSATASASEGTVALQGNFVIGILPRVVGQDKPGVNGGAWCVRGGQSVDAQ